MKGKLLIVDDEFEICSLLAASLKHLADEVVTAANGQEALVLLQEGEFHCVVSDIRMPVMNGIELIQKMREQKIEVPLIFYTGHGNEELMLEAAKYGAFDFIDKPLFKDLGEVVLRGLQTGLSKEVDESVDTKIAAYRKLLE